MENLNQGFFFLSISKSQHTTLFRYTVFISSGGLRLIFKHPTPNKDVLELCFCELWRRLSTEANNAFIIFVCRMTFATARVRANWLENWTYKHIAIYGNFLKLEKCDIYVEELYRIIFCISQLDWFGTFRMYYIKGNVNYFNRFCFKYENICAQK